MSFLTKERIALFLASASTFFVFLLFSYIVHKDKLTQFDFNTTVHLQDFISRRFDGLFSMFSIFGNFEVMIVVLILFLLFQQKIWGIFSVALFGLFHLIEIFGKYFVNHPPPPHFMLRTIHPINMPQFYVSADFSYPSGHSGRTMFLLALMMVVLWNSKKLPLVWKVGISSVLLGYTFIMVVSRVYLGEHWTTDVIGGGLLGLSFGLMGSIFLLSQKSGKPVEK